jgi:hypothetical protein
MHPKITVGAMALSVVSCAVALANAITALAKPISILDAQHAEKIIAAAAIIGGIGSVIAGLGKSPLETK